RRFDSSFFFHDPAPPALYTLSLHDALPILEPGKASLEGEPRVRRPARFLDSHRPSRGRTMEPLASFLRRFAVVAILVLIPSFARDRKSTRLNSSHVSISYAVFCLKKKKDRP